MKRAILAGTLCLFLTACDTEAYRERQRVAAEQAQLEQRQQEQQRKAQVRALYDRADDIAQYSMPNIEITIAKSSVSLDPWKHLANAAKTQRITFPVSEAYFNQVSEGTELDSQLSAGALIFEGNFESYNTKVSRKFRNTAHGVIVDGEWQAIDEQTFKELQALNRAEKRYQETSEGHLVKKGDLSPLTDTCDVEIESRKSNLTLDLGKMITNAGNTMNYAVSFPRFLCEGLTPGKVIKSDLVGASLIFSSSPSSVEYRAKSVKKNYK